MERAELHKIAVISDTHNLLRPEVLAVIEECEAVFHAGDISKPEILEELRPGKEVFAVRGNNDRGWAEDLPFVLSFRLFGFTFCMAHMKKDVPEDHDADVVIFGHSHRYTCSREGKTLYLNPGSCGPRRFNQEITMAVLTIRDKDLSVRRIDIPRGPVPLKAAAQKRDPGSVNCRKDLTHNAAAVLPVTVSQSVTTDLVRTVCRDVDRNRSVSKIAADHEIDRELTDQIVRMYLTHPGVTPEKIMEKLGL